MLLTRTTSAAASIAAVHPLPAGSSSFLAAALPRRPRRPLSSPASSLLIAAAPRSYINRHIRPPTTLGAASRDLLPYASIDSFLAQSRSIMGHSHGPGQGSHAGHAHGASNTYLTSSDKNDPGVRITRIGLYMNLAMAIIKGAGGYAFNSKA